MPIQLQNHRTSNAKLFSVGGGNKQKLHTAASLQAHKNNLKVRKNDSGSGFQMMSRMFTNPTNATPNLPDAIPDRNCRQKPGQAARAEKARRHSMSASATTSAGSDVPSTISTQQQSSPSQSTTKDSSRNRNSPRRQTVGGGSSGMRKSCSKSPMRRIMGSMSDASSSAARSPMRRIVSMDYDAPNDSNHSQQSNKNKKGIVRRSRSFGPMSGQGPVIKNIAEAIGVPAGSVGGGMDRSSMDRSSNMAGSSRRRSTLRRGSNDSAYSAHSAASAPMRRPHSDPLLPLDDDDDDYHYEPPSPRDTLRATREKMRRKSYGGGMTNLAQEDEMAYPIPQHNTPPPPQTIGNLLDDIAADDSDDGDDDISLDSFLSNSS